MVEEYEKKTFSLSFIVTTTTTIFAVRFLYVLFSFNLG